LQLVTYLYGLILSAAELMQYLNPPDFAGPSLNTWPGCEFAAELLTSMRSIPNDLSLFSIIASARIGLEKAGHPQPELNLSVDANIGSPLTTST
jgi:hypothetical protein